LRGGSFYKGKTKASKGLKAQEKASKGLKAQAKARSKQEARKEVKRLAKEEGRTKAKGTLLQEASRNIFKGLQGIREGLLLYQVHLYMFFVLYILL
jgi:hypothetical protein